jgi:hypothetical protein
LDFWGGAEIVGSLVPSSHYQRGIDSREKGA